MSTAQVAHDWYGLIQMLSRRSGHPEQSSLFCELTSFLFCLERLLSPQHQKTSVTAGYMISSSGVKLCN